MTLCEIDNQINSKGFANIKKVLDKKSDTLKNIKVSEIIEAKVAPKIIG